MKRCPTCGSRFGGDDQFCPSDGSVLIGDASAEIPTVVLHSTPPNPAAHPQQSPKWIIPAIGVLCGVVVVLAFFAFYKTTPADGEKKDSQASDKAAAAPSFTPMPTIPPQAPSSPRIVQVNSPGDRFLALRTEPSSEYGIKILEIPHGERISLGTCQQNFELISGKKGRWCQTNYGGMTGWIFDAYVRY